MRNRDTVLVVEDDPGMVEKWYKPSLSAMKNLTVEYANTEHEAIEKARCRTYDAAFVDIMLTDASTDRGGVEVIRYLHELNEGTGMIVVSGTDDIKVAIEAYGAGVVEFVLKERLRTEDDILNPLRRALGSRLVPNRVGRYSSLCSYLAAPQLGYLWEAAAFRLLGVGFELLDGGLWGVLERMLPIMRPKAAGCLTLHSEERAYSGTFWSKGIGEPIWLSFASKDGSLVEPPKGLTKEKIVDYKKGGLLIGVWSLAGVRRDEYRETVWETFQ